MKDITRAKGLAELRTATTHHIPAKPPRKGTTYLDLFSLSMEKQRLEQELAGIERQRKRVCRRLVEVQRSMEKLVETVQPGKTAPNPSIGPGADQQAAPGELPPGHQWRRISLEY